MADIFAHERLYRGVEPLSSLAAVPLTICGAGALGSHLADNLARQGFQRLKVIDRDRVEQHNAGTQIYGEADVGGWKVDVLRGRLFRAVGVEIETVAKELTERNARALLKGSRIVVDVFDNARSRQVVQDQCRLDQVDCLHVGLSGGYAEAIWDEYYRVPRDAPGDPCDYPLARNLVLIAVAVASEVLTRFVVEGIRTDWSVTLRDFAVRRLETPDSSTALES